MKDVKSIEFVFENCDNFEIEAKHFASFQLEEIKSSVFRVACNAISKFQTAYSVVMEIFSDANVDYSEFGQFENKKKFDRILAFDDITYINLKYSDDTEESFFVDYNGEETNENQKSYLSSLGHLYIVIENGKDIWDFFDKEEIENKDHMDNFRNMIID